MMKRSRFLLISRFLHFSNDEVISSSPDRLHKIRELVDGFRVIWKFNYTAISTSPYLSVDETIIPFKGRLIIKQYMPNKPHRFGIEAFSVCDSKTDYVINWKIYAGKENGKTTSSKDVVLTLLKDFKNKGYATKMMNQFINDMRKKGKTSIILSSVENAVSYYQKLEFEAIDDNLDDYPYLKKFEVCSDDKFTTVMEKIL